jgi:iduronate 2-sulfatase
MDVGKFTLRALVGVGATLRSLIASGRFMALGLIGAVALSATDRRPNVLFIVADDLRVELGAYGDTEVISPHLDALAARGVLFNRAYCQQAVCNPSRASVLTGRRPDSIKVWDLAARFRETSPDVVTLPEHFRKNGYITRAVGKIFHNEVRVDPKRVPMSDPASWSSPPTHASGAHWQDWVVPGDPAGPKQKGDAVQALDVPDEAYFDGQIATEACDALRTLKQQDAPFFLAVGFWKPHLPFNAPKKYWDRYDRSRLAPPRDPQWPKGAPELARHPSHELRGYGGIPKTGPLTDAQVMELRHGYYAGITFLDAMVGRVLDELEKQGLAGNTIVVFWSDHGFHLGERDLWAKTSNYELDARVPLIVAAPERMQAGRKTDAIVELLDLYPTLVDLAGLPAAAGLEGRSFAPVLADPELPGKSVALTQHPHPFYGGRWTAMGYAVRSERYRYIEWRSRESGEVIARELYDHRRDPGETINCSDEPGYAEVASEMALLTRRHHKLDTAFWRSELLPAWNPSALR